MNGSQTLRWAWNNGSEWINTSESILYEHQLINVFETILLPSFISILCSTGFFGNIFILFTIIRYLALVHPFSLTNFRTRSKTIKINVSLWAVSLVLVLPSWMHAKVIQFQDGLESCAFDLTSPQDILWYTLYHTLTSFFVPLPLILICYVLILCYTWDIYQENKRNGRYDVTIPRARLKRLTKMVLVLVGVFVVSSAPYHVLQLVNLKIAQPTTVYFIIYYTSICLSYASSSLNPLLYVLLSGNFQRRLTRCTKAQMRVTEREIINIESTIMSNY